MPFSFPISPSVGQKSTQNGRVYVWTGLAWELSSNNITVSTSDPVGGENGDIWIRPKAGNQNTPAQITSNQNNYNPGIGFIYRLSSNAAYNITGWTAWTDGNEKRIVNVGSFTLTLKHQDTNSSANNRFITPTGGDYTISAGASATIYWDATDSRVRIL